MKCPRNERDYRLSRVRAEVAVILKCQFGFTYKEVANFYGVSTQSAYVAVAKGLRVMKHPNFVSMVSITSYGQTKSYDKLIASL